MDMLVLGKPLRTDEEQVPARFVPVQTKPDKGLNVKSTDKGEPGIYFGQIGLLPEEARTKLEARTAERKAHPHDRPPPLDLAKEHERKALRRAFADKVTEIEIDPRPGHPVFLETGSLGAAIKMLDQCSLDSLKDWGADPALEDKIVRPVWLQNRDRLISADDYPRDMLIQGQQSDVKVRVLVDASGRVTKCTTLSHFKFPEFNQLVCNRITRNAKFAPAELADGTKVASYYTVHIDFRIGH
jgi:TonB family protein